MMNEFNNKFKKGVNVGKDMGFTIIELLVAMAISLVVMTSVYSVYRSQQKSYIVREQVSMMQQNLRAGMAIMTSDIRMAGYKPPLPAGHAFEAETVGILTANPSELEFKRLNDNWTGGKPDPTGALTIKYSLTDHGGDGDNDLVRDIGAGNQLVAENIDALNFVYIDMNGTVIADPPANLGLIKSIQVTMVARTGRGDPGYSDAEVNSEYKNQQDDTIYTPGTDDSNRRRVLSREIRCRNL